MFRSFRSIPLLVLAAAIGGLLLAFAFSAGAYRISGTTVEVKAYPARPGVTVFKIPPLGEIKANTHRSPVGIAVSLEKVSFSQVKRLADTEFSQRHLVRTAEDDLGDLVRSFVLRLLVLGAIGGLAAGLLLPARNARRAAVGALAGLLAVTGLVAVTARDYDVKAWRQPRYSGMLTAAPWLIDTVEDKLDDFDSFRDEMRQTANNLYAFYTKVDNWESVDLGRKRLKVLHVGDVHNNPVAFDIIREIVRDFHVDLIIDTGDLTDFGTPVETGLVEKIGSLGVPYVFVAGNHDSPPVLEALKQQENVIVAEKDTVVKAAGLRVLGLPEAAAEEFSSTPEETEALRSYSGEAGRYYEGLAVTPDIVAAHEYGQIKALVGLAPAILIGHTHQPSLFVRAGTVVADVGTSGAAGIRNFEVDQDLPYSFKLLYFDDASHDLLAVDSLALSGTSRDFVLERRLIRGTKERLPKRAGSANLDLSWKTGP